MNHRKTKFNAAAVCLMASVLALSGCVILDDTPIRDLPAEDASVPFEESENW